MIGSITPAMLVLLLRDCGYEVTLRCLTDWRRKGYLPQLARVSRGFGKGVVRYWDNDDILERALSVCRRLKGPDPKREFGSAYKNWLCGAEIPPLRAQESWLCDLDRRAHVSKEVMQKSASEVGGAIQLKSGTVRDTLEEMSQVWLQPNYTAGKALDIFIIGDFIRRVCDALGAPKTRPPIDEKVLAEFLVWVNALFSPAGVRGVIASATCGDLCLARDRYLNWWKKRDAGWQGLGLLGGGTGTSSLMPLAHTWAPVIVPFLLPIRAPDGRLPPL